MENLKKLIEIKSNQNGDEIVDYLIKNLTGKVKDIKVIKNKTNEDKSLLIGFNTELKNCSPIVLSGHLDTVNPNAAYSIDPFTLTIKDGKGYGLGTIDMKSFTAIILDNLATLSSLPYPVIAALTTDEETKFKCIETVIDSFKELNITPIFTIVGEPSQSKLMPVANGCYVFQANFYGKAAHSSKINQGINAVAALAKLVTFIEESQKEFSSTCANPAIITGGEVVNKVPDFSSLKFDIRTSAPAELDSFIKKIENKIESLKKEYEGIHITLDMPLFLPPFLSKDNNKIESLAKILNLETAKFDACCESVYYTNYCGDAVIFGIGDLELAHKADEYVDILEYKNYSKLFLKLLNEIAKLYN